MCPKLLDTIRPGVEVSSREPSNVSADALVLPWRGDEGILSSLLEESAPSVLAQLKEYPEDRDLRLTSAGMLPLRFLLHLSLPARGSAGKELLRSRMGELFQHARVLALRELAFPIGQFADAGEDFPVLVEALWESWKEEGEENIHLKLLVDDQDLRAEYLRRFLQRRRGASAAPAKDRSRENLTGSVEGALRPVLPAGLDLEQALERLLEDYREGRPLDDALALLNGPMSKAFAGALEPGEELDDLPGVLRVLGAGLMQRLPWELLKDGSTFLGERFLFPRGSSFYVLGGRNQVADTSYHIEVFADENRRGALTQEIRNLLHRGGATLEESKSEKEAHSVFCASGLEAWENLLADENLLGGEMIFLEKANDWEEPVDAEELAGRFLARGFRRVLSPMAAFRDPREARIFRMAFFEQYFRGHGAGGALRYAQRALLEAFGIHSGWFLYRIFGQAEDRTYATRSSIRKGMDLSKIF
jgi:hypothetical protein